MWDENALQRMRAAREGWSEAYRHQLPSPSDPAKATPAEDAVQRPGVPVQPLYSPLDMEDLDYEADIGWPGQFPFTRGAHPTMYRGRPWTMRQYAGYGTAAETNRRFRYLLEHGTAGLSIAFDLPTQMGFDSDHTLADGEVGKSGVAIDSLADMETLFQGIPLDQVTTSMTINAPAAILLAMYIALGERQGVSPAHLRGTVQNDILKEYLARGTYIFPPDPSMRLTVDLFEYCLQNVPRWNMISISGYHIREAGCDAVQEVAFTLANAIAYVEAAQARGMDVDAFAPRLSFFFNAHSNFLEEVAKFRAARRLWAEIMQERFGAGDPRSWTLRFHTQTAGSTLTAQQPELNVIRVAYQALAAVLGGTQSLHTNAADEALGLPSEDAGRVALRTQQLLAHELGVDQVIDPLGGSYCIEALTKEIATRARAYLQQIDDLGGAVRAIEQRYIQREIEDSAYRQQQLLETGQRVTVGVNRYVSDQEPDPDVFRIDEALQAEQIRRVRQVRADRDNAHCRQCLDQLQAAARQGDNMMPALVQAVKAYATVGEICDTLRDVFGEYRDSGAI